MPLGTLVVNLSGCLVIGLLTGLLEAGHLSSEGFLLADVGFTGAYTTFSTLSYETVRLMEQKLWLEAFLNPTLSLLFGLFAVSLGLFAGRGSI